jgi:hypothetical protein
MARGRVDSYGGGHRGDVEIGVPGIVYPVGNPERRGAVPLRIHLAGAEFSPRVESTSGRMTSKDRRERELDTMTIRGG